MGDRVPNQPAGEDQVPPNAQAGNIDRGGNKIKGDKNGLIGDIMSGLMDGRLDNKAEILQSFILMAVNYFCKRMNIPEDISNQLVDGIGDMFDKKIPSGIEELIDSASANPEDIKGKVFLASTVVNDNSQYSDALSTFKDNSSPASFVKNFYPTLQGCFNVKNDGAVVPKKGATMPSNFVLPTGVGFKKLLALIAKNANYFQGGKVACPAFFGTLNKVEPAPATPEAPKPEAPKPEAPKPEAPATPETPAAPAMPEAPKPEAPKPEAPKPEAPKPEAPKPEAPKPEAPAMPKPETPAMPAASEAPAK